MLKRNFHYAWVVVSVCILVEFGAGCFMQTVGVFASAIKNDLNISMASVSLVFTIFNTVMILFGPVAAKLVEKFSLRNTLPIVLLVLALVLIGFSNANNINWFYLLAGVGGCCMYFLVYQTCPYLINNWFKSNIAEMLGVTVAFFAVGGAVGNLVMQNLIELYNWRIAYRVLAAFYVIVLAFYILLFLRDAPVDIGEKPYQRVSETGKKKAVQADILGGAGLTVKGIWFRWEFVFIVLFVSCMQFCVGMQSQIPNFSLSIGFSAASGAFAASVCSLGGIPAKFLLSWTNVKIGVNKSIVLYNIIGILGLLFGLFAVSLTHLYIFAFLFGFALGSATVQLPVLTTKYFGGSDEYAKIHARVVLASGLLAMPGTTVFGWIYDITGGYRIAIEVLILLMILAVSSAFALNRKRKKEISTWQLIIKKKKSWKN